MKVKDPGFNHSIHTIIFVSSCHMIVDLIVRVYPVYIVYNVHMIMFFLSYEPYVDNSETWIMDTIGKIIM